MSCEAQHAYTCHNQRQLSHASLNIIVIQYHPLPAIQVVIFSSTLCQIQPQKCLLSSGCQPPVWCHRCGPPLPLLTPLPTQIIWSINRWFRQRMLLSWLSNCSMKQFTIYIAFSGPLQHYCVALYLVWRYKTEFINYAVTWPWSTAFDFPMASASGKNETVEQLRIRIISANSACIYKVYKVLLVYYRTL